MLKQLTLGAAIVAGALLLTPASTPASAAPLAPVQSGVADGENLVQQAHWRHRRHHHHRHHHHRWRHHYYDYNYNYNPYSWGYYYSPYYYYDDWRSYRRHHRHHHHRHW